MIKGKYIVLEGPEGVGKTTQLLELARRLQAAGLPVRTLREPDSQSDLTARAIRQLTQDPRYPMNTRTEVLLYNAARAQSLSVIKQSVDHGVICLVDRNYLTTLAIQYYGRGDVPDYETINTIINFAVDGVEPDLCVLLDAPVATLKQRLSHRYNGERFDNLDDGFLERVRAGYLWEAHQRKLPVVFATDDTDTVANNIWDLVSKELAIRAKSEPSEVNGPISVKEIIEKRTVPISETVIPKVVSNELPTSDQPKVNSGEHLQLGNISSLLAMSIKYVRGGVFDEQSTAEPVYHVPEHFKPVIKKQYVEAMDKLLKLYSSMLGGLTNSTTAASMMPEAAAKVLEAVLPMATTTTISVNTLRTAADDLFVHLTSQELPEAKTVAQKLQNQANILKTTTEATERYIVTPKKLSVMANQYLPDTHATAAEAVTLLDFWPKNELLLVADILYEQSNLSLEELQSIIGDWSYERKNELLKIYIDENTIANLQIGKALEKAHYSWDITCDYPTFCELQRHQIEDFSHQFLTPRYGYDTPNTIEDAGLTNQYEECFEISLKLHDVLKQAGYNQEAQYAVLQGHKLRCKLTYNAREAFLIVAKSASSNNLNYHNLINQMREKLGEVHPLTAESIQKLR